MSIHSAMATAKAAPPPTTTGSDAFKGTSKRERILRAALAVVAQVELRHSLKFMSLFSQEEVADYLNILRKIVESGQREGTFRRNLHPQLVAKAVFGVLDEMVTSWILSEKDYDVAAQADQVADLILTG